MTAKVLFFKTSNNTVSVKVNLGKEQGNGFSYRIGTRKSIRFNKGEDYREYPIIVSYSALDSFLSANGIDEKSVIVDENSIDTFYGYDSEFFVSLAKSKVEKWWNYDCPRIYRFSVNKDGHQNWIGLKLICFQNLLVESTWSSVHIGDDITEEEVEKLAGNYKHTLIYKEMEKVMEARTLSESDIEDCNTFVKSYEEKLQKVVDEHKYDILKHAIAGLTDVFSNPDKLERLNTALKEKEGPQIAYTDNAEVFKQELLEALDVNQEEFYPTAVGVLDGSFGFDCGWVNIYTHNQEYNDKKKLLKNLPNKSAADWTDVRLPIMCQSTTIQKKQFEKISSIIQETLGESLYSRTMLD